MTIIENLQAELSAAGRVFADHRLSEQAREDAARDRFRTAFPAASRQAEENFMTRLYRAEAAEQARMAARAESNRVERERRAGLTKTERRAEVADGLRRLRAGEAGIVGRIVAG